MTQEKNPKDNFSELRQRAEETFGSKSSDIEDITTLSPEDIQRLVYELRVHQVELEIQNENLRQSQVKLEELKDKYLDLYNFAPVGYITLNEKGLILEANLTIVRLLGVEKQSIMKMPFSHFITQEFGDVYHLHLQQVFETKSKQTCEINLVRKEGSHFYVKLESLPVQDENEKYNRCRTIVSDITERIKIETEREHLIEDLQTALAQVKTLKGMLPICSSCKKIRNDKGYWQRIEEYIGEHSEAEFSHGLCNDCEKKLYNGLEK